jgi:hypothetical protein
MDLVNIILLLMVIAIIALVPCGCIMTRHVADKPRSAMN